MTEPRLVSLARAFALAVAVAAPASPQTDFGGAYSALEPQQQALIDDWVRRFIEVTGQEVEAEHFFDDLVRLSTKTTFDAVTHALMRSTLTDDSGAPLGTALDLIASLETVKGKVKGASGDQQFRMYVVLKPDAVDTLEKSREFKRGVDNTIFHKGYPTNYRQQGGVPSIQISIARGGRRADIDVDYRSSSFPVALFNGHLSATNSDVRAGNNDDRHNGRWTDLLNWWQGLFGVRLGSDYDDKIADERIELPERPRAGDQTIDKMTHDFLTALLVEKNIIEAMGYVSERAYPCVAMNSGDEADLDLGMAPFVLLTRMKAAVDALGEHDSLEGLTAGVRLSYPALKLVRQDYHSEFVLYSVPDDVAAEFDCANRLKLTEEEGSREYGNYFGAVLYINGPAGKGETLVLLWAREEGYWKIVSWEVEPMADDPMEGLYEPPEVDSTTIPVDEEFAAVVREFLTAWFVENDYDEAFRFLSPKAYSCYNLYRQDTQPMAAANEEAGRFLRAGIERAGTEVGKRMSLESVLAGVSLSHPSVRVMTHPYEQTYTLASVPNIVAEWADCGSRSRDDVFPSEVPLDYGDALAAVFRFRTTGGEAPVLRLLWMKENGEWRITAYDIAKP